MTEETATIPPPEPPAIPEISLDVFETRLIALRELHESPKNPRRFYAGMEELSASIRRDGLRIAIVARPRLEGGGYEIAAGARRFRAAKMAGLEVVPVQVRDLTDAQLIDYLAFENDHRKDFNELERAQGWRLWMEENAADIPDLIEARGLKPAYVYKTLKLLEAISEAQEAYVYGKIKVGHLEQIARIPAAKGQRLALRACEPPEFDPEKVLTTRELKVWIAKNLHTSLLEAPFSVADPTLTAAGACEPCPHRLGNAPDFDPDEDLPHMCMRRECFDDKVKAHVNTVVRAVLEGRKDLVLVSELGGAKPDGMLPKGDWYEARSGEASAKAAFVVEGPRIGREIRVVVQERIPEPVTPAPPAPAAVRPPAKRKKSAAESEQARLDQEARDREFREQQETQERERQQREKQLKTEAATRLEILTATLKRVEWPPKREDIARLISHTIGEDVIAGLPENLDDMLAEIFGVKDYRFVDLSVLPEDQLARLAVLMTLADDFDHFALSHGCDPLHAAAKRYGVDVEKIRRQAMEAEGGTREEVATRKTSIKKLPVLNQAKKPAPKKAPAVQHLPALLNKNKGKKAAPKSAPKKAAKKGGKK
jgi:ParB/RepB/Spo0J family partition protein